MNSAVNSVQTKIEALVAEFKQDQDWEARYKRVIEKAKTLAPLPPQYRDEKFKVKGCQSQVWLHAELGSNGGIILHADSDAVIVRGLVACLVQVYNGGKPDEILQTTPSFIAEIGFDSHLSPSRANGFNAMLKQIYLYATAFKALSARA